MHVTILYVYKPSVVQSICDTLLLRVVFAVLLLPKCLVSLFWQRPQWGRSPVEHMGTSICPSERVDFRPERANARHVKTGFRPERANLRPERADSRPERAYFRPDREDFEPERANHRSERALGVDRWTE